MTRRWTVRLAGCLVAGVAVLAGCSEEQEAAQTLPSPSSAAPAEEELPPLGPADLPMPAEARTPDAAGAEAFVRYYIELINRTSTVMDAQPLREFSDGCRDCDRIADNTEEAAAAGNAYRDGEITITRFDPPLIQESTASITIAFDQDALAVVDSVGNPVADGSSEAYTALPGGVGLRWHEAHDSWLITDFTVG
ncbi:hypothetical protein JKP75_15700 [Blastococcus sp. TML/M2B]|uniref:DUF6318 family protein n=1 Tax=unclassified Blastococcus TaxID=2619396 RepID=UPI00190A1156|nr:MULTISPECIES: DUF6318 family protein [unclassified Blastococcus]MBN1093870.1 hypothetical protein [Blastococcus sp. TML/M2B]MBN1096010.1 hypothetical protein [Blastococcus sp. TML/C7B]